MAVTQTAPFKTIFAPVQVKELLTSIAQQPSEGWETFSKIFTEIHHTQPLEFLNTFHSKITPSLVNSANNPKLNNPEMHVLFRRAVINLNANQDVKAQPVLVFRQDHAPPPFLIPKADIHLDIAPEKVTVTTQLQVQTISNQDSLILDCKNQNVLSVSVNGVSLREDQFCATKNEIIIHNISEISSNKTFSVETTCEIDPYTNKSGAGLYKSGKHLTTQCEAQDASSVFPTLDRPDIFTEFTTTITADPALYPHALSNGQFISAEILEDGRKMSVYHDEVPKPCYLFAAVLGKFDEVSGEFRTKEGRDVKLRVLVEEGQKERATFACELLAVAMKLDEDLFGRIYNHDTLTCVAMDDFNAGAMENTTLMIFNALRILISKDSGTDKQFREIFRIIAHEYCHNWRGNQVAIRDFFEVALKEAFTDWASVVIEENVFGEAYSRIAQILDLQAKAFPLAKSPEGHPLKVLSYENSFSIYDGITYVYGREIFRALSRYLETYVTGGSRQALDDYFETNKGKAVSFEALLECGNKVLKPYGKDLKQFEEWFTQQGIATVEAAVQHGLEKGTLTFNLSQSNIHPATKQAQLPLPIPFSYELLREDGSVALPRTNFILDQRSQSITLDVGSEPLIPVFMHGYSAPVTLKFPYTSEQLATIALSSSDAYCQWRAGQDYAIQSIQEILKHDQCGITNHSDLAEFYKRALQSETLSHLAKSQLLTLPSLGDLAQALDNYDFEQLGRARKALFEAIFDTCNEQLYDLYINLPRPEKYEITSEHMQVRDLRNTALQLLVAGDSEKFGELAWEQYQANRKASENSSANFTDGYAAFTAIVKNNTGSKTEALKSFFEDWKADKTVFNHWLSVQSSGQCTIEELEKLTTASEVAPDGMVLGFDEKNPNHLRSIYRTFIENVAHFHKPDGSGYRFIVDAILKIGQFNSMVANNYIYVEAVASFFALPETQQALFAKELEKLLDHSAPAQIRKAVDELLNTYKTRLAR